MEAMELKSMDLDKLENSSMEEGVKYARRSFCKKLIFGSFNLRGVFWELQKIGAFFWRRLFLGKLYLSSKALKRAQERPKLTSFDPPNVLNKLLSKNSTLTRRCEVNKFNLVTYFSL